MRVKRWKSVLFFMPFLAIFIFFWLSPFLYGIYTSLHAVKITTGNSGFVGIENYVKFLTPGTINGTAFYLGLKNTLIFVAISVIPLVLFGLMLALALDRLDNPLKSIFRTIFFLSYAVSVTAVAAIFIWIFNGSNGYINNVLVSTGLITKAIPWLEGQPFAWITLLIATVWWTIGFNMMLFINALNEIDTQLYEASSIDGANYWNQLITIILPNIRNVFFFVLMTTVIASFNVYGQAQLITKGGPQQGTKPLAMVIYQTILEGKNLGIGSAMALVMGLVVVMFVMCQNILTREINAHKEVRQ